MVKPTSLRALVELHDSGAALTQKQKIRHQLMWGSGSTRQEVANATGISINAVCGRVSELLSEGLIATGQTRACRITGKQVETLYAVTN